MTGKELIAKERQRQIESEGYSPEHDDWHDRGQLLDAAKAYQHNDVRFWPIEWDRTGFKPSQNRKENLIKSWALYQAEIDRLERKKNQIAIYIDNL